jgi:hypothetical protein
LKESLLVTASAGVSWQRTHVQLLYLVFVEARSKLDKGEEKDEERRGSERGRERGREERRERRRGSETERDRK